jgi:hypothetical protein
MTADSSDVGPILPLRDLLVTAVEINDRHGVGILLQRIFPDSSEFVCLRSMSLYGGSDCFGSVTHELRTKYLTISETREQLKRILAQYRIRRIVCVPYYREDFVHAVMAQQVTGAPLVTYLMDDQNILTPLVPDRRVAELFAASKLVLGISPEMCAAYSHKYGRPVHLLPPVLTSPTDVVPCYWDAASGELLRCAMICNVWTAQRFGQLRELLRTHGLHLDWFGNGQYAGWLQGTPEEWEKDNIRCMGFLPEEDLVANLAAYPFVIVPSGSLDQDDDNHSFSRMSLPSRLLFLHAHTDTPILMLGSKETAAGRFVMRAGTGVCADYESRDLARAVAELTDPAKRQRMRQAVRRCSKLFILPEAGKWLWDSLAQGQPVPAPFHELFQPLDSSRERWLGQLPAAKKMAFHGVPTADLPRLADEQATSFSYLKRGHFALLEKAEIHLPSLDDIELTQYMLGVVQYFASRLLPARGRLLFVGEYLPEWVKRLPAELECWHVSDIATWAQDGFAAASQHFARVGESASGQLEAFEFDAVLSTNFLDQVKTPEALSAVAHFLTAHTRPGGFNFHGLSAVLHPTYYWMGPACEYLRKHWNIEHWPELDDLQSDDDLFSMSEKAYATFWQAAVGRTYADFGKPLGVLLFWRKAAVPPSVRANRPKIGLAYLRYVFHDLFRNAKETAAR